MVLPPNVETGDSEVKALITQLSSPISVKAATATLGKMFSEKPETFADGSLAIWAHDFMSKFYLNADARLVIGRCFGRVPLIETPAKPSVDQKELAQARAQIFEYLKKQSMDAYTAIPVPVVAASALAEGKVCADAVEVYVADEEFKTVTKLTKDAFYALPPEEMAEVRKKLISHASF
jgi:hypothetical protein